MPIEIRELIIKTTVDSAVSAQNASVNNQSLVNVEKMSKRLLEECKHYINQKVKEEKER